MQCSPISQASLPTLLCTVASHWGTQTGTSGMVNLLSPTEPDTSDPQLPLFPGGHPDIKGFSSKQSKPKIPVSGGGKGKWRGRGEMD